MKSFANRFVQFPDYIKTGIVAVFVWVAAWLFGYLVSLLPFLAFLADYIPGIASAAAAAVIAWMQNAIPDGYDGLAEQVLKLILMVLAIFGIGGQLLAHFLPSLSFAFGF